MADNHPYLSGPFTVIDNSGGNTVVSKPNSVEISSTKNYRTGEITVQSDIFVIWDISNGADFYEVSVFENDGSAPESVPLQKVSREQAMNAMWGVPLYQDVEFDQGFGGILIPALKPFTEYKAAVRAVTKDGYTSEWAYSGNVITTGAPLGAYLINNTFNVLVTYKGVELSWENSKEPNGGDYKSTVYQCVVEISLSTGEAIKRFVKGESLFVKLETGTHIDSITITPLNSKNEYDPGYVVTKDNDGGGWTIPQFLEVENEVAIQQYTVECQSGSEFEASDDVTITTPDGTIRLADGTSYTFSSIDLTIPDDNKWHYIYFDTTVPTPDFAVTDNYIIANGPGKIYIGAAKASQDSSKRATFLSSYGVPGGWSKVITADYIAANTITANEIDVHDLFAQNIDVTGSIHGGKSSYDDNTSGWWMGRYAQNDYRLKIGDSSSYLSWYSDTNGGHLTVRGGEIRGSNIYLYGDQNELIVGSLGTSQDSRWRIYAETSFDSNKIDSFLELQILKWSQVYDYYEIMPGLAIRNHTILDNGDYITIGGIIDYNYVWIDDPGGANTPRVWTTSIYRDNNGLNIYDNGHPQSGVPGDIIFNAANIRPRTSNTQSIGTSSYKFNDGYFTNLHVDNLSVTGLDADTLDGHDSTYFLGNVNISGGSDKNFLYFDEGGTNQWIDVTAANMRNYLQLNSYYLGLHAKADDSDKLDGYDASHFMTVTSVMADLNDVDVYQDVTEPGFLKYDNSDNIWYTEDAATFRTSLGLGNSATKNVGTASGTVAAGDHLHDDRYLKLSGGTLTGTLYPKKIDFNNRQPDPDNPTYPSPSYGFEWEITTDGAGMQVYERGPDQLDYVFWMRDNMASVDRFIWEVRDYRGTHAIVDAIELYPGRDITFRNKALVYGDLFVKPPTLSVVKRRGRVDPSQAFHDTTIVRNNQNYYDPDVGDSQLEIEVDTDGYTRGDALPYIIKIKDDTANPNTFCWGHGYYGSDVNDDTKWTGVDIPVSTDWIELDYGVKVRFNQTTGGESEETFGFTVVPGGSLKVDSTKESYIRGALAVGGNNAQGYTLYVAGTQYVSGQLTVGGIDYDSLAAPTNLTLTESSGEVTVTFSQSATANVDEYEVWRSETSDSSGFVLIAIVNKDDMPTGGSNISIIDDTIDKNTTIYYRVYAIKTGIRSSALTGSINVSSAIPDVTNLQIIPGLDCYIINYDIPDDERYDHVEIYVDKASSTGALDRANAQLTYTGKRCTYIYQIPDADKDLYHQFWVETKVRS